jgi:glucokinase
MAPKMQDFLSDGRFMTAFRNKGRMSFLVAAIPVRLVIDPDVGLIGAQVVAERAARAGNR